MDREYLLSFSSFYKAAYARDILEENGINGTLRKLPTEVARSCSTGVYVRNHPLDSIRNALEEHQIMTRGIFAIRRTESGGPRQYVKVG